MLALATSARNGLWRTLPAWLIYVCVATGHLLCGMFNSLEPSKGYPIALLYFEPFIIILQILLTFEASLRMFGVSRKNGSPESRLLLWLIPVVPVAIVLPIEIGFIRDAFEKWSKYQGDALMLVYGVRKFLSITLLIVLTAVPLIAGFAKKQPTRAALFHHRILIAYFMCASIGYLCKAYVTGAVDLYVTIAFFVVGPLICFVVWSLRMWNCPQSAFDPMETSSAEDRVNAFDHSAFRKIYD